jgi:chaperonin cofactor prefoldin
MHDPNQLIVRLGELIRGAGENYYERIQIADTLLKDKEWVEAHYSGDAFRGADHLEECYFHDLCGMMTIWDLMQIYRKFPKKDEWVKHKYNLRKMFEFTKVKTTTATTGGSTRRAAKVEDLDRLEETNLALKKQLQTTNQVVVSKDKKIEDLETEVRSLQRENARLNGRIEELESLLDRGFLKERVA